MNRFGDAAEIERLDEGWLKDEYRNRLEQVLIHSIRSDTALSDLSVATKLDLHGVGIRSTGDVRKEFLQLGTEHIG